MCPHHHADAATKVAAEPVDGQPAADLPGETLQATSVDHVGLSVQDLDAAVAFYRNAFGLNEEFRFTVEAAGPMTAVVLRSADGWAVELLSRPDSVDPAARYAQPDEAVRNRGYGHLCLRVQDLDGVYQRVLAAGASQVVPPSPSPHPAVRYAYLADIEGNLLELIHFRAGVDLAVSA